MQSRAKLDANLKDFEAQLAATDKQVGNEPAPSAGKGYFVFHGDATYAEKHYGLTPLGHFTVNPEIQIPGAQRLHEIRTQLVEQKQICAFAEPQFRPKRSKPWREEYPFEWGTRTPRDEH